MRGSIILLAEATPHLFMTLEELKSCHGFTVQVSLDGAEGLARIDTLLSADGQPMLSCPSPSGGRWGDVTLLPISEGRAASFRMNGTGNIFSMICLVTDGSKDFRYAE